MEAAGSSPASGTMTDLKKAVAAEMVRVRQECELRQKDVAEMLGVTQQTYAIWETGRNYHKFQTLEKVAAALGYEIHFELRRKW